MFFFKLFTFPFRSYKQRKSIHTTDYNNRKIVINNYNINYIGKLGWNIEINNSFQTATDTFIKLNTYVVQNKL